MATAAIPIKILPGGNNTIHLSFPYDIPTIDRVKQLPQRRWNPDIKCWEVPDDAEIRELLLQSFGRDRIVDCTGLLDRLSVELRARKFSNSTVENYSEAVARFLKTISAIPQQVTNQEIKQYLISLHEKEKLAPRTVNLHAAAIAFFCTTVINNPAAVETVPRMKTGRQLPKVYSEQDVEKMLSAEMNPKHRLMLMLAYGCGLRLSELRYLKRDDVQIDRELIVVRQGKGKKDRLVPLGEIACDYLELYLNEVRPKLAPPDQQFIFVTKDGRKIHYTTVSKLVSKYGKKAGLKKSVSPHGLRHTCATHLLKGKADIRQIQELLGHENLASTQVYTKVEITDLKQVLKRCHPRERREIETNEV